MNTKEFITSVWLMSLAMAADAQPWLTNGLVAHYVFNGDATDVSGHGFNGTVVQATTSLDRYGNPNSAFSFNGSDSHISFTSVPLTQVDNWTMSAWVKPASTNQYGYVTCMGYDDGTGFSANGYALGMAGGDLISGSGLYATYGGVGWYYSGYDFPLSNQWYQVVAVRDAGEMKCFINGIRTENTVADTPQTPTAFRIGSATGIRHFAGLIDDVRIYERALSTNEVTLLYAAENHCSPHKATAIAQVVNGFVVGATITDTGCGYTNTPTVLIQGGGGSGATATAVVSNGVVIAINVTSTGCCYTNTPKILIASPPFVPSVSIHVSRVNVVQRVVLGRNYLLEFSNDLANWTPTGPPFTAQSEEVTTELIVGETGRFFRIREVP